MTLFRSEVVEFRRGSAWGEVRLSQPPSLTAWTCVLVTVGAVVMVALIFGSYIKKETVAGYLAPESGVVQISASRTGKITRLFAREGDHVNADSPLVELSGETAGAETGRVLAAQLAQIEQQIRDAKQKREASLLNLESERRRLDGQVESQTKLKSLLESRLGNQRQMIEISTGELTRYEELAQSGFVSRLQLNEKAQQVLVQQGELNGLEREIEALSAEIADKGKQVLEVPAKRADMAAASDLELSTLEQKRIDMSAAQRFIERSPVTGTVSSLQAQVGQTPMTNVPLLSIMPDGAALQAELLLPTRAAGFIKSGDEARLQIEAYPFQRFGFVMGRVFSVSKSILKPGEFLAPVEIKEAVYRVRVVLDRDYILAYGQRRPLRPGMALTADIVIDRKPLWRQLFDPLLAAAKRVY
jgi:membrane fusion protein